MGQTGCGCASCKVLARFYAKNRRDGARLLSSALVLTTIALFNVQNAVGLALSVIGAVVCLYWWSCYRQLER